MPKKGGGEPWTVSRFKRGGGGLAKRGEQGDGVFEGGYYPINAHYDFREFL